MIRRPARAATAVPVLLVVLAASGCSFRGSVTPVTTSTRASVRSSTQVSTQASTPSAAGPASGSPGSPAGAPSGLPPAAAPPPRASSGTGTRVVPPSPAPPGPVRPGPVRSSPVPSSPVRSRPAPSSPSSPGPDRCHTSELSAGMLPGEPGAGQRHATLVLTNDGPRTCTVLGYAGLQLVGADGRALPTHVGRMPDPAPAVVTLAPGRSAAAQLTWSAVAGPGDNPSGDCQPTAAGLQVIPPDETDATTTGWAGGPVCQQGGILEEAFTPA